MRSIKNAMIVLVIFLVSSINNYSSAETAPDVKPDMAVQQAPAVKKQIVQPGADVKDIKNGICDCLKGTIDAIQKAYVSLEEDEWPAAIKSTKDAIAVINTVSKDCTCPETQAYQKIAEAYLKYAEGGSHLDGAEEPDCPYATKLYSDAITLLETFIPKITNSAVKENAEDIKGYVKEEKEFVDEECGSAQKQESPKGVEGTKEKKQ